MKRRHLLTAVGAAAALSWLWPVRGWLGSSVLQAPQAAQRFLAALRHPASAAEVGRAYLASAPAHADVAGLVDGLTTSLSGQGCDPARARKAGLRAAVARQIRDDFATGRTVRVDGWILSVTEARLCALAAVVTT